MHNILFAWELGSGLGHLNRLIAIARQFETKSNLFFAIPSSSNTESFIRSSFKQNIFIIRMRSHTAEITRASHQIETSTLADVLHILGFADASRLQKYFDDWQLVLQACRPALIVADFAPMLRMTTDGSIPLIVVGNGYTVPPPGRPLPPLRPWQTEGSQGSTSKEQEIACQFNKLRRANKMGEFSFLSDVFSGDMTFPCTCPLFDPYRKYRTSAPARPFNNPRIQCGAKERTDADVDIFVYLPSSHPVLRNIFLAFEKTEFRVRAYISGSPQSRVSRTPNDKIAILTDAADFSAVLPNVRLLVHHGGLGTAYAGLLSGTPQLVLPVNLEHLITSRALLEAGVAQGFSANTNPSVDQLCTAISTMMTKPTWLEKACEVAATWRSRDELSGLNRVVIACNEFLAAG